MKTTLYYSAIACCLAVWAPAQPTAPSAAQPAPAPSPGATRGSKAPNLNWQVTGRDWCSTTRDAVELVTNATTGQVTTRNHRYVSVGSGLNYLDDSGNWRSSRDLLELTPDGGAAALRCPTKIYFSPNLNVEGAVTIATRSNRVFTVSPAGLYYFDCASGQSACVASIHDCAGEVLPNRSQIVFKGALGELGDIRFTVTRAGAECDLVLLRKFDPPEAYGFSNAATCRLEIWSAWTGVPEVQRNPTVLKRWVGAAPPSQVVEPDLIDETIRLGELLLPIGHAFSIDPSTEGATNGSTRVRLLSPGRGASQLPLAKRWIASPSGNLLVESLDWSDIKAKLDALPRANQGAELSKPKKQLIAGRQLPPQKQAAGKRSPPIRLATLDYRPTGYVADFIIVDGTGQNINWTFDSGVTYYVESSVYNEGNGVTFQPSCVVKCGDSGIVMLWGTVTCNGSVGAPSILCSKDDDAYGETLPDSNHNPTGFTGPAIWLYYPYDSITLSGMRFRWAQTAVQVDTSGCGEQTHAVADSAFEFCGGAIYANNCAFNIQSSTQCGVWIPTYTPAPDCTSFSGALTDVCGPDADGNGLPDAWEYQYFGHVGVNPNADADGDGVSNYTEYLQGRNPVVAGAGADSGGVIGLQVYTPLK